MPSIFREVSRELHFSIGFDRGRTERGDHRQASVAVPSSMSSFVVWPPRLMDSENHILRVLVRDHASACYYMSLAHSHTTQEVTDRAAYGPIYVS